PSNSSSTRLTTCLTFGRNRRMLSVFSQKKAMRQRVSSGRVHSRPGFHSMKWLKGVNMKTKFRKITCACRIAVRALMTALLVAPAAHAQGPAVVLGPISNPLFVNIYWDANWDADNPAMPRTRIDNFTSAVLNSSYFSGLAEYGVGSPSLHSRSFVADPQCGN